MKTDVRKLLNKTYLLLAGATMMLVGSYISINTLDYITAMSATSAAPSINLLSDLRGMGGLLLVLGGYVFTASFSKTWQASALVIATTVYTAFVLFRVLSLALDGLPDITILAALAIEITFAALGFLLIKKPAPESGLAALT